MNFRKKFASLVLAATAFAVVGTSLPAHAAGTTELEVSTWSVGAASSSADITDETRLVIDGATQVSWEVPDHNVKVTKKQLRKAPRIRVNATGANSSKVIFKTAVKKLMTSKDMTRSEATKAAGIVVLKTGSCVRNTGRENALRVGFVWCLAYDAVLVFDKPSGQYRHAYNIRDGKLIKTCLNYIGGNVPMRAKVVQVRYEEDVEYGANIMAVAEAKVSVKFALTCPNGASFQVDGFATAYGRASDRITFTSRTRVSKVESFKLKAEQNISINQDVFAAAGAGINIKATCGEDAPPPVVYQAPTVSGQAQACVKPGQQTGVITTSGSNPNNVAAPGTLTIGGKTQQFGTVGAGQTVSFNFTGFAPGNYSGSFTLGSPINKSATFTVTVAECVYQNGTIVEVTNINDVLYGNTRTWRIRGVVPDGQSAVLKVSADIGTVKESDKSITLGSGAFDLTITYTAPTEGSSDTLKAQLFGPDGVLDAEASDTFELRPNPVDPL